MVRVAERHGHRGYDHAAGHGAGGADLQLQHDHRTPDAGRNRCLRSRAQLYTRKLQRLPRASTTAILIHGSNFISNRRRVTGDDAEHAAVCGRRFVAGFEHDFDARGLRFFHVADPVSADPGMPGSVAAVVVAGAILLGAAASGLFAGTAKLTDNMILLFSESVPGIQAA